MTLPIDTKIEELKDMIVSLRKQLIAEANEASGWSYVDSADTYEKSKELVPLRKEEE